MLEEVRSNKKVFKESIQIINYGMIEGQQDLFSVLLEYLQNSIIPACKFYKNKVSSQEDIFQNQGKSFSENQIFNSLY